MTDSERVEEATRSLLERHPDVMEGLETLVEVDRKSAHWTFDDIPLDSGRFGELVSRGIAESVDDGYQLVDPDAVTRVLTQESATGKSDPTAADGQPDSGAKAESATGGEPATDSSQKPAADDSETVAIDVRRYSPPWEFGIGERFVSRLARLNGWTVAVVAMTLSIVAAVRSMYIGAVFRNGDVVSPANDPYFYRYWQHHFLDQSTSPIDVSTAAAIGDETRIRPLTHALNWWFATLLGGTPRAADLVAALVPVLGAVAGAWVLYLIACRLTGDRRVGLVAILLLALTPIHAVYTSLGFLEHRVYQYLWLSLMVFSLVWLAADIQRRKLRDRRTNDEQASRIGLDHARCPRNWAIAIVLALAVAASAHTWGGSPLTFVPLAFYLAARVIVDIRHDVSPLFANAPAIGGIAIGGVLSVLLHRQFDWHEPIVATTPLLVAVGGIAVALLAALWARLDLPPAGLLASQAGIAIVGLWLYRRLRPEEFAWIVSRADALFDREDAVEARTLFVSDSGILLAPLAQIGIGFFIALVVLLVVTWLLTRRYEPGWLVVVCFTWYYLLLAGIQARFGAQLSIFLALLAAVGVVYLLGVLELTRRPVLFSDPDRSTRRVRGKSDSNQPETRDAPTRPGTGDGSTRPGQDGESPASESIGRPADLRTALTIAGVLALVLLMNLIFLPSLVGQIQYSSEEYEATMAVAEHVETVDEHPETFVLSHWGDNRMHNFFVTGESRSYRYALDTNSEFLLAEDPDAWYDEFDGRVGYLILRDDGLDPDTTQHALFEQFGAGERATGHYQLLYAGEQHRAFVVVEGAQIRVNASDGDTVTANTTVSVGENQFHYERSGTVQDGEAVLRVAYPGVYDVDGKEVTISNVDVYTGRYVTP